MREFIYLYVIRMNKQQCLNAIKMNGAIRQIVEQLRSRCVHKIKFSRYRR